MRLSPVTLVAWLCLLGTGCPRPLPPWMLQPVPDAEAVGVYHRVQEGETLSSICRNYQADCQEVAEVNGILDPDKILAGQRIFIPDASGPRQVGAAVEDAGEKVTVRKWEGAFIWPVEGVLTSRFGIRRGRRHDGIDIAAPEGTPIRAAADGQVLYAGNQQTGYGNLVILRHAGDMITVYAHNQRNLVAESDRVEQGQTIGLVGSTGRSTGPHLHFEIRKRTKPRNPLFFLPRPE